MASGRPVPPPRPPDLHLPPYPYADPPAPAPAAGEDKRGSQRRRSSRSGRRTSGTWNRRRGAEGSASKTSKKKKKPQSVSLAAFTTDNEVTHGAGRFQASSSSLTHDEHLVLPTSPRECFAEELERSSRGFGYSSYGGGMGGRGRISGEESNSRWRSSRASEETRRGGFGAPGAGSNRDLGPSRADEMDDWDAGKSSVVPERREREGGLFDSQSLADESGSPLRLPRSFPELLTEEHRIRPHHRHRLVP